MTDSALYVLKHRIVIIHCLLPQGTHKVVERRMNMKDIIKAVEEKRVSNYATFVKVL